MNRICNILIYLVVFLPGICTAAPSLVYSTMVEDSTYYHDYLTSHGTTGAFAGDVDTAGNLYVAAPISDRSHELPEGVSKALRIYKISADGSNIEIFADIDAYEVCSKLVVNDTGIYIQVISAPNPAKIIKLDANGAPLFMVDSYSELSPIFVDKQGCLYILGTVDATDVDAYYNFDEIQVTPNALDPSYNGQADMILQKYDPDGNLLYSSFLGGSENDIGQNMTIDSEGNIYISPYWISSDFPYVIEGIPVGEDVHQCLIVVSPNFDQIHAQYLQGSEYGSVLSYGKVLINNDNFYNIFSGIKKFSLKGELLLRLDMKNEFPEIAWPLPTSEKPLSFSNNAMIAAFLDSPDLIYSVHFKSSDAPFTTTADALYPNPHQSYVDLGIWQLTEDAELLYGTYFGGSNAEETTRNAVAFRDGKLYVAGYTESRDFPLTPGSYIDTRTHGYYTWGLFAFCIDFSDQPVAVDDDAAPAPLILDPPYPNPFNPQTTISFTLPEAGFARLAVYDISGQLVRELTAEALPAGRHAIVWDGRDSSGATVGSGLYIARLTAGEHVAVRKVTLVR